MIKNLPERIKKDKRVLFGALIAILGVMLMLIPVKKDEKEKIQPEFYDVSSLKREEEKRISAFLERIQGVDEAWVMISYKDSGGVVYGYNTSDERSEMVIRRENGDEMPVEEKKLFPTVSGVSVIYRGNPGKKITVARAVSSATGAEIHNVEVVVNEKR